MDDIRQKTDVYYYDIDLMSIDISETLDVTGG